MSIRVKFFGSIRETVADAAHEVDAADLATAADVWRRATSAALPDDLHCAINHAHATVDAKVTDGDEVAFFPTVTGG
ncbi:MAG: molybdopterin synthase sulfur carrier subunit [Gammaproteobacteria bacterium]|nr:MAG: molybdopterin synthase sulfur carrier subunit [Gammaproteobacteria bacterium]